MKKNCLNQEDIKTAIAELLSNDYVIKDAFENVICDYVFNNNLDFDLLKVILSRRLDYYLSEVGVVSGG